VRGTLVSIARMGARSTFKEKKVPRSGAGAVKYNSKRGAPVEQFHCIAERHCALSVIFWTGQTWNVPIAEH
jgi:hypothetical protein